MGTRPKSRTSQHPMYEDVGDVGVMRSLGLDDRAARMNEFWRALVDFQYSDVLVVALCVGAAKSQLGH